MNKTVKVIRHLLVENTNLFSSNINFSGRQKVLRKVVAQLILNGPLWPNTQYNLAGNGP
jgi:hypothetical protein